MTGDASSHNRRKWGRLTVFIGHTKIEEIRLGTLFLDSRKASNGLSSPLHCSGSVGGVCDNPRGYTISPSGTSGERIPRQLDFGFGCHRVRDRGTYGIVLSRHGSGLVRTGASRRHGPLARRSRMGATHHLVLTVRALGQPIDSTTNSDLQHGRHAILVIIDKLDERIGLGDRTMRANASLSQPGREREH